LKIRLTEIEVQRQELDQKQAIIDSKFDFDKHKVNEDWVSGWFVRIKQLMEYDMIKAQAKLMALVGEFTITPEIIEGIKYLRVTSKANDSGLLEVAVGGKDLLLT